MLQEPAKEAIIEPIQSVKKRGKSIMTPVHVPVSEREELDRFYRAGGLKNMASPHIHYENLKCPYAGCMHRMEWIDFKLECYGDPEGIYKPLVRAWWEGT